ncbi:hypothetical protein JCM10207_000089 [Rhodosporidiobolus poonsookiae]
MPRLAPPQSVLIVGGGEFGSTAALSLVEGPYRGHGELITLVERGAEPPAVDAASSDYNKVRADYADPLYQKYALDAIAAWRTPQWAEYYHECGVSVVSSKQDPQVGYVRSSHRLNEESETANVSPLESGSGIKRLYDPSVQTAGFEGDEAYLNRVGGWAATRDAVVGTLNRARRQGVRILHGEADSLIFRSNGKEVAGVRTCDGRTLTADVTILACGSWTPRLLPELAQNCLPTGQTVCTIKLNEEERKKYAKMPVTLCMDTGFYCFPPTADGILKMAIHDRGWLAPSDTLPSLPRTHLCPGFENQQIPATALAALKRGMARVHPELSDWVDTKLFETRLCWYSDRESGDFLFDYHPSYGHSLFVAAGGSGHAAKFFPLVGKWIVDSIQGALPRELSRLWCFHGDKSRLDKSRGEGPIVRRDLDTGKVAIVKVADKDMIKAKL